MRMEIAHIRIWLGIINGAERILACNKCGHVQMFRLDMAEQRDWWDRR